RLRNKTFVNYEDAIEHKVEVKYGDEEVERKRRAHRNDLENCIPFMIIGFFYCLTSPSSFIGVNVFRIGALSRILHTVAFLYALQPWRFIGFLGCILVTIYMAVQVLLFF
ncbi:prostaglandin E synthase-like, partial [Chironomus tepperi]|uniref:prostaglandin E synthase-like n=1 Tax=Chironomus tepperi TaxID=113505 RepID=UPI00391F5DE3